MSDLYMMDLLRLSVAQICQTIGYNATQTAPMEILQDILHKFLLEFSRDLRRHTEHFNRNEANFTDTCLTLKSLNINVHELLDYINNVEPVPFVFDVPKFPAHKESNLNFLKPGSTEVLTRPVHIYEYLPPILPPDPNNQVAASSSEEERTETITTNVPNTDATVSANNLIKEIVPVKIDSIFDVFSGGPNKRDVLPPTLTKRTASVSHLLDEEGRPTREISSVVMTTGGFISPAIEGKLPEAIIPDIIEQFQGLDAPPIVQSPLSRSSNEITEFTKKLGPIQETDKETSNSILKSMAVNEKKTSVAAALSDTVLVKSSVSTTVVDNLKKKSKKCQPFQPSLMMTHTQQQQAPTMAARLLKKAKKKPTNAFALQQKYGNLNNVGIGGTLNAVGGIEETDKAVRKRMKLLQKLTKSRRKTTLGSVKDLNAIDSKFRPSINPALIASLPPGPERVQMEKLLKKQNKYKQKLYKQEMQRQRQQQTQGQQTQEQQIQQQTQAQQQQQTQQQLAQQQLKQQQLTQQQLTQEQQIQQQQTQQHQTQQNQTQQQIQQPPQPQHQQTNLEAQKETKTQPGSAMVSTKDKKSIQARLKKSAHLDQKYLLTMNHLGAESSSSLLPQISKPLLYQSPDFQQNLLKSFQAGRNLNAATYVPLQPSLAFGQEAPLYNPQEMKTAVPTKLSNEPDRSKLNIFKKISKQKGAKSTLPTMSLTNKPSTMVSSESQFICLPSGTTITPTPADIIGHAFPPEASGKIDYNALNDPSQALCEGNTGLLNKPKKRGRKPGSKNQAKPTNSGAVMIPNVLSQKKPKKPRMEKSGIVTGVSKQTVINTEPLNLSNQVQSSGFEGNFKRNLPVGAFKSFPISDQANFPISPNNVRKERKKTKSKILDTSAVATKMPLNEEVNTINKKLLKMDTVLQPLSMLTAATEPSEHNLSPSSSVSSKVPTVTKSPGSKKRNASQQLQHRHQTNILNPANMAAAAAATAFLSQGAQGFSNLHPNMLSMMPLYPFPPRPGLIPTPGLFPTPGFHANTSINGSAVSTQGMLMPGFIPFANLKPTNATGIKTNQAIVEPDDGNNLSESDNRNYCNVAPLVPDYMKLSTSLAQTDKPIVNSNKFNEYKKTTNAHKVFKSGETETMHKIESAAFSDGGDSTIPKLMPTMSSGISLQNVEALSRMNTLVAERDNSKAQNLLKLPTLTETISENILNNFSAEASDMTSQYPRAMSGSGIALKNFESLYDNDCNDSGSASTGLSFTAADNHATEVKNFKENIFAHASASSLKQNTLPVLSALQFPTALNNDDPIEVSDDDEPPDDVKQKNSFSTETKTNQPFLMKPSSVMSTQITPHMADAFKSPVNKNYKNNSNLSVMLNNIKTDVTIDRCEKTKFKKKFTKVTKKNYYNPSTVSCDMFGAADKCSVGGKLAGGADLIPLTGTGLSYSAKSIPATSLTGTATSFQVNSENEYGAPNIFDGLTITPTNLNRDFEKKRKEHKKIKKLKDAKIKKKKDKKDKSKNKERNFERYDMYKNEEGSVAENMLENYSDKDLAKKLRKERKKEKQRIFVETSSEPTKLSLTNFDPTAKGDEENETNTTIISSESAAIASEESTVVSPPSTAVVVPKLTFKFSSKNTKSSTICDDLPIKPTQSHVPSHEHEKKEPSPELARISPLVTRPPKQKINLAEPSLSLNPNIVLSTTEPLSDSIKTTVNSLLTSGVGSAVNVPVTTCQLPPPSPWLTGATLTASSVLLPHQLLKPPKLHEHHPPSNTETNVAEGETSPSTSSTRSDQQTAAVPLLSEASRPSSYIDAEGNRVWICPACGKVDDGSAMIGCDGKGCDAWYHWVCVGIFVAPKDNEDWFCRVCITRKVKTRGKKPKKMRKK